MTNKVPPEDAVVWICGKFPGRIHKRTDGSCRFTSGVPKFQRNRDLQISDILWEESRKRWYTMDPNARPVAVKAGVGSVRSEITLIQQENAAKLIQEGLDDTLVAQSIGISQYAVNRIREEIKREFWEGK